MKKSTCTVEALQVDARTLMVRIPLRVAKHAGLHAGQPIRVEAVSGGVMIRTTVKPSPTLAQKLEAFESPNAWRRGHGDRPQGQGSTLILRRWSIATGRLKSQMQGGSRAPKRA